MGWAKRAARQLARARRDWANRGAGRALLGGAVHGPAGGKLSLSQAYAVQAETEAAVRWQSLDYFPRAGVKVANTNATSQGFLGVPHPFYSPILATRTWHVADGGVASLPTHEFNLRLIETEIALRLGKDLRRPQGAPPLTRDEVADAVTGVLGAIEVIHTSYRDWQRVGGPAIVADLAAHGAFVFGAEVPATGGAAALEELASLECSLIMNGVEASKGRGEKALGGPLRVLEWLANEISERSRGQDFLRAGDVVPTGVLVDPPYRYAQKGDSVELRFAGDKLPGLGCRFD